ncbi:unnamed protein product [Dicrocoelium dendriticum]|nr:unnamed protein product [Dicrocoelium dendriticum]
MLSCLFLPKLYIIYFQPEKNVRRLNMSNRSAKLKLPVVSQPAYLNAITKQHNDVSHLDSAGTSVTTTAAPTSTSLTLTSSTHAEEQFGNLEGSTEIQAPSPTVMNPRPPGSRPSLNVISNPIALSLEMKSNSTQQRRPTFTEILPNRSQLQPLQNGMQQFPNEFLIPTPISLDTIAQQSMLTPPDWDEPTSAEEDEFYPGRRALFCDCGASSSSQILSNLCTTLHSISNSSYSGQTPHSSDFYLHSCGEDTQVALSTTSTSSSVESEMVFRQLRQSKEAKSRMDSTKQTVTAL